MKTVNYLIASLVIVFAVVVYIASGAFVKTTLNDLGPSLFPRTVAIGLAVLGSLLIFFTTRNKTISSGFKEVFDSKVVFPLYGMIFSAVYIAGLVWLGYLAATALFVAAVLWFLRMRQPVRLILISIGTSGLIYLVFEKLLTVPLPRGELF